MKLNKYQTFNTKAEPRYRGCSFSYTIMCSYNNLNENVYLSYNFGYGKKFKRHSLFVVFQSICRSIF